MMTNRQTDKVTFVLLQAADFQSLLKKSESGMLGWMIQVNLSSFDKLIVKSSRLKLECIWQSNQPIAKVKPEGSKN